MRNLFYAMVSVSLLSFTLFSVVKSNAKEVTSDKLQVTSYPYQIIENKADGQNQTISGQSDSIEAAKIITDLQLDYYQEDRIKIFPDPSLGIGATLTLDRAPVYFLKDGKRSKEYRSWTKTVAELFKEKNIELGADDKVGPSLESQIFNGSQIAITRVAITNVVEAKPIDFTIQEKEDPNLDYGKKRVDAGVKGEKKLTYRVTREDGEEVSRILLATEITKQPKTQINYTGTKVTILSSVRGRATIYDRSNCLIVSVNYKRGTLIRITNLDSGVKVFGTVDCTWGTAKPDDLSVLLDLSRSVLSSLKWNGRGAGPSILVEEIKQ
ncbi:MAG: G5 domain-containing protein [Patescibacteria group bacterium]